MYHIFIHIHCECLLECKGKEIGGERAQRREGEGERARGRGRREGEATKRKQKSHKDHVSMTTKLVSLLQVKITADSVDITISHTHYATDIIN